VTSWGDDPELLATFRAEVEERLASLQTGLLALEEHASPRQVVGGLFRDAHTVKGSARMLGLEQVLHVAHSLEDLLGALRDGRRTVERPLVDLLLAACDAISRALPGGDLDGSPMTPLTDALQAAVEGRPVVVPVLEPAGAVADAEPAAPARRPAQAAPALMSFGAVPVQPTPTPAAPPRPPRPLRLLHPRSRRRPPPPPATTRCASRRPRSTTCSTSWARPTSARAASSRAPPGCSRSAPTRSGGRPRCGRPPPAARCRCRRTCCSPCTGSPAPARRSREPCAVCASWSRATAAAWRWCATGRWAWRWSGRRMLAGAAAHRARRRHRTGKDVALVTSGEDVELDKQVLDGVADALKHLVINAVDHGCEPPRAARRRQAARATVTVTARSVGGTVVLEVSDDGAGVDEDAVRAAAVRQGLLPPDSALTGPPLLSLLFTPALSTSRTVTETSGRGVGSTSSRRGGGARWRRRGAQQPRRRDHLRAHPAGHARRAALPAGPGG
jgi:HPt (histidine-containing phosphotransfer) domain-containing protein